MFYIDIDENIGWNANALPDSDTFSSEVELMAVLQRRNFSKEDVTALWNSFAENPGFADCKHQKKIKNRPTGVAKIWAAIQRLMPESAKSCGAGAALDYHENVTLADGESFIDHMEVPSSVDAQSESDAMEEFDELPAGEVTPVDSAPSVGDPEKMGKKNSKGLAACVKDAPAADKPAKNAAKGPKSGKTAPKAPNAGKKTTRKAAGASTGKHRDGTKREKLIAMLKRKDGASGQEIQESMGWLSHTVRGLLSTLNSKGVVKITSERDEKRGRVYKAA